MCEVPCVEHPVDAPVRRDGGEGLQYEAATRNLIMRDGEAARAPLPAAPQDKVEVEHAPVYFTGERAYSTNPPSGSMAPRGSKITLYVV